MIKELPTVSSTNDEIKQNAISLQTGDAVYTLHQTNGRGRRGRRWEGDKSLALSIYFDSSFSPLFLPVAAALAVRHALLPYGLDSKIKWPNDLLADGKKLCGILCETCRIGYVVGIGLNLNQTEADFERAGLPFATSLLLSGISVEPHRLATEITHTLIKLASSPADALLDEYREHCLTLKKAIRIEKEGDYREAFALDIDDSFGLVVEYDGKVETVLAGEVSIRGLYGYEK